MEIKLVNIGGGCFLPANRIIGIESPDVDHIKHVLLLAHERGSIINCTQGRKTNSVIIIDTGHVVLSSLLPEELSNQFGNKLETDSLGNMLSEHA
jgi:hypothetical protein